MIASQPFIRKSICNLLNGKCIVPKLVNLEEIKLIDRKSNVDLELLALRHLQSTFICNHMPAAVSLLPSEANER